MGGYPGICSLVSSLKQRAFRACAFITATLFLFPTFSQAEAPAGAGVNTAAAHQLLQRMVKAGQSLNYRGAFTYEYGGALKTAKILHLVKDGREYERLIHLSGPVQEVIRHGDAVDCQRAGNKLLQGLSGFSLDPQSGFQNHYDLHIKGKNRIAGRPVTVVHVIPRDIYRYGYALSVDRKTGLLMQSMLMGKGSKVLERYQFVDIHFGVMFDEAELAPADAGHYVAGLDHSPCLEEDALPEFSGDWIVDWLPPGFVQTGEKKDQENGRTSLIFTDGLSVFSVFIDNDQHLKMQGVQAHLGATVAFLMHYASDGPNYSVGVVGEIPPATARRVAQSVRLGN